MEPCRFLDLLNLKEIYSKFNFDNPTKAALRCCNKEIKKIIDFTITSCVVDLDALDALLNTEWPLKELKLRDILKELLPEDLEALVKKFRPNLNVFSISASVVDLPANIGELQNLKAMVIFGAFHLTNLPSSFAQLTGLEKLELRYNALTLEGIAPIQHLKQLKHLEINSRAQESEFSGWVIDNVTTSLEHLEINISEALPSSIGRFKHLTSLNLLDGQYTELPESIGDLTSLEAMVISGARHLSFLPPCFAQLNALERLEIVNCRTLTFEGIAPLQHLDHLKHLKIDNPAHSFQFPEWLCNNLATSLGRLHLNILESFPPQLSNFKHLTSLNLFNGRYTELPESIGDLSELQTLVLSDHPFLLTLPDSFSALTALRDLSILSTRLEDLGPLQHLTALTALDIYTSEFPDYFDFRLLKSLRLEGYGYDDDDDDVLSDGIGNLPNLEFLKIIGYENLYKLPGCIGNLARLTTLVIENCPLVDALPETLGRLHALKELSVINCREMQALPESIGNLNLEVLTISECEKLSQLPSSFEELKSLKILHVTDCGFVQLPESVNKLWDGLKDVEFEWEKEESE
jgi:Leucine-rich repeat (LRR) protein